MPSTLTLSRIAINSARSNVPSELPEITASFMSLEMTLSCESQLAEGKVFGARF